MKEYLFLTVHLPTESITWNNRQVIVQVTTILYKKTNKDLWHKISQQGLICSKIQLNQIKQICLLYFLICVYIKIETVLDKILKKKTNSWSNHHQEHRFFWLSLAISPYWSLLLASTLDGIQCLHKADECKFFPGWLTLVWPCVEIHKKMLPCFTFTMLHQMVLH